MKKILCIALSFVFLCLAGCTTRSSKSYTFNVETGDKIKVTLETGDGYQLIQKNGHFMINKNDELVSEGFFITTSTQQQYEMAIENLTVKEDGSQDHCEYTYYETVGTSGKEYNYLVKLNDAQTGIIVCNFTGKDEAVTAFERLSFEKN